jgi:hypothetical protein
MENKIINVNSIFRDTNIYPNASHFKINLPDTIKNICYMKITSVEIGNVNSTFSNFRNNNSFKILTNSGANEDTINIGEGNFTSDILMTSLQNQLDVINTSRTVDISIDIDIVSGKLFFSCTSEITLDFSRTGNTDYKPLKYYLGYNNDINTGTTVMADNVLNLLGVSYIYLNINDISNVIDEKVPNSFTKIVTNVEKFNTVYLSEGDFNSKDKVFRSPIDLSYLEIKLVDYLNNELTYNNFDYSFTLEVGYIYDLKLYKEINNKGEPNGDIRSKFSY